MNPIVEFAELTRKYIPTLFDRYNELGRPILNVVHQVFDNLFYTILFITVIISAIYYIISFFILFKKEKMDEQEFSEEKAPFVTVQIPTYNEIVALRCADKCLDFDYPKERYEVIIGDDSNDITISSRIDEFAKNNSLIKVTRRGNNKGFKAGNLNNMLKHSKGDIIVIFDSDFVPNKDFLKRIVTPFIYDKELQGVQARWKFINQNKNLTSILATSILTVFHHISLPFTNMRKGVAFLCGSAEAVRKDILIKLGGWQNGSLTEDIEYSFRLLKKGYKIRYIPTLECGSEVPVTPKDLYKQQKRWAYGVVKSLKEHYREIWANKKIGFEEKFLIQFLCSGYLLAILLLLLLTTGLLSIVTHEPAPIQWGRFFYETTRNIILTSGLIAASIIALIRNKQAKSILKMMISSFSLGLVMTYHVNIGIIKVFLNKKMHWFMLDKEGNKAQSY